MSRFNGLGKSQRLGRTLGSPALFTIVYTSVASAIYFSLGVVADNALDALGRGPVVVPGAVNRLAHFVLGRLLPRRTAIDVFARSTKELS